MLKTPRGRPRIVPPRMHAQDIRTSAIEPSQHDDLVAGLHAPEPIRHLKTSQASGAPSPVWRGTESRFGKVDSTLPKGFASKLAKSVGAKSTVWGTQQFRVTISGSNEPLLGDPLPGGGIIC